MIDTAVTSTSAELRYRCRDVWQSLVDHRFVGELAAGTLPLPKFRFYIEQDILFLDGYARAIGLAIGRTSSDEELRELTGQLAIVVERELENERKLLRRVEELSGSGGRGDARPAATTISYANFLVATAVRGDALDVMTALLPCAWSYADIGRKHIDGTVEHPIYTDWLRLFSGSEYLDYVDRRLAFFDRLAAPAAPRRWERLSELFSTATRLETAFWNMAYAEEEK
jgi:thiaminase/transcriptional activator TenA